MRGGQACRDQVCHDQVCHDQVWHDPGQAGRWRFLARPSATSIRLDAHHADGAQWCGKRALQQSRWRWLCHL